MHSNPRVAPWVLKLTWISCQTENWFSQSCSDQCLKLRDSHQLAEHLCQGCKVWNRIFLGVKQGRSRTESQGITSAEKDLHLLSKWKPATNSVCQILEKEHLHKMGNEKEKQEWQNEEKRNELPLCIWLLCPLVTPEKCAPFLTHLKPANRQWQQMWRKTQNNFIEWSKKSHLRFSFSVNFSASLFASFVSQEWFLSSTETRGLAYQVCRYVMIRHCNESYVWKSILYMLGKFL